MAEVRYITSYLNQHLFQPTFNYLTIIDIVYEVHIKCSYHKLDRQASVDSLTDKFITITEAADSSCWKHLGCYNDVHTNRAISGGNRLPQHNDDYKNDIRDLVNDCYDYARSQGWTVFAPQNQNECYTSADAEKTYHKHGEVDGCNNGKGGFNALDAYEILCPDPGKYSPVFF